MPKTKKKTTKPIAASNRGSRTPGIKTKPIKTKSSATKKKPGRLASYKVTKPIAEDASAKKKRRGKMSVAVKAKNARDARLAKKADEQDGDNDDQEEEESNEEDVKLPKGAPKPEKVHNAELGDEGLEYEVEAVIDSRLDGKRNREYLVKWVGWSKVYNTWEPEVNLQNAFDKITEYDEKNPDAV